MVIIEIWWDMKYIYTSFLNHKHILVWLLWFTFVFNLRFCNKICVESLRLFLDTHLTVRVPAGNRWDGDCSQYPRYKHWQKIIFKKKVNGVGGLFSLVKKDCMNTHLFLSFLYHAIFILKVLFKFCGKPDRNSSVSRRIKDLWVRYLVAHKALLRWQLRQITDARNCNSTKNLWLDHDLTR